LSVTLAFAFVALATLLGACGTGTATPHPSQSLVALEFTPLPTRPVVATARPSDSPEASSIIGGWPPGWDVGFCTAFTDITVAHELVIDIERAISDKNTSDAQGLANELAQTAPVAAAEISRIKDLAPATDLKTSLANLIDLDTQAATAYQSFFNDGVKTALKEARTLRNQVSKAVPQTNDQLQQPSALGLSCSSGADLKLETF
jgi:hypothetical protein